MKRKSLTLVTISLLAINAHWTKGADTIAKGIFDYLGDEKGTENYDLQNSQESSSWKDDIQKSKKGDPEKAAYSVDIHSQGVTPKPSNPGSPHGIFSPAASRRRTSKTANVEFQIASNQQAKDAFEKIRNAYKTAELIFNSSNIENNKDRALAALRIIWQTTSSAMVVIRQLQTDNLQTPPTYEKAAATLAALELASKKFELEPDQTTNQIDSDKTPTTSNDGHFSLPTADTGKDLDITDNATKTTGNKSGLTKLLEARNAPIIPAVLCGELS